MWSCLYEDDCYSFTSDIDAQQQIFTTRYYSNSNIRKQLRRYPSTLYSVECGIDSVNVKMIVIRIDRCDLSLIFTV